MAQEQWKPVPGYEGFYEVSDQGRVRSVTRVIRHETSPTQQPYERTYPGKMLSLGTCKVTAHRFVNLFRGGRSKTVGVHRLVLAAFVGPCPEGMEACHANDVADDNRPENLRWDTRAANRRDAVRNGRLPRGESKPNSKLTEGDVVAIRKAARAGTPQRDLAATYMVHPSTIWRIVNGERWHWLT